jgi:O-antigen/teichoic acid export membrane protein
MLAIVIVVASLRYELAIPLPVEDQDASHIVVLSLLIVFTFVVAASFMAFFFAQPICDLLGVPKLGPYFWLLPIGILFGGGYKVLNYWAIRTKSYQLIARTRIKQSLATLLIQLAGFNAGGISLLIGQASGQGVGSLALAKGALSNSAFKHINCASVGRVAKRYRKFPILSTWEGLANAAGAQLAPLLFASLFGAGAAGLYALAHRILSIPMTLVGSAIGQVFFSDAAEAKRADNLKPLVVSLHAKLTIIAMPPTIVLMVAGPEIFSTVFGGNWQQSGVFARWMAPWLYFVFTTSPLSTLFAVIEKQGSGLMFQIVLLIARIAAISLGAYLDDLLLTIILFSSVSAICWVGFMFWVGHHSGKCSTQMLYSTIKTLINSLLCLSPFIFTVMLCGFERYLWLYGLFISIFITVGRLFFQFKTIN